MFPQSLLNLIKPLVPFDLQKPRQLAWLLSLHKPLGELYSFFMSHRSDQLRDATINSQKNRLQQALRDKFGSQLITIIHPLDFLARSYIYLHQENAPLSYDYLASENHAPVIYDYLQAEYDAQVDFIVRIPAALGSQSAAIAAFVSKYKFPSKTFKIEQI